MYQPSSAYRSRQSLSVSQYLKICSILLLSYTGPLLHGSVCHTKDISPTTISNCTILKGHLESLLRFITLSKKQLSKESDFGERILQCFNNLHNATTISDLERVRAAIYSLVHYQPARKLTELVTYDEQLQEILHDNEVILQKILDIKLTPYQKTCRVFAQSPLLQTATVSAALAIAIAGTLKLNQIYRWSLFHSIHHKASQIFPFIAASTTSPKSSESPVNHPYSDIALSIMSGIVVKLIADEVPALCMTAAGYFNESMSHAWTVFDKFKANQQNVKPRGPSIQSLKLEHVDHHGNLKSYLVSSVEYLVNKPSYLAMGVPHSSGVIIIGDTTEADRMVQATAAFAHKRAQEQPISLFSKFLSKVTGGYCGGGTEIPLQRYEAAEFVNTDTNIYDVINVKKLKTHACIIVINNLDMDLNPEQKARLIQKLNALSGLMNDPTTQYFFIGTARDLKNVPQELYTSPLALFKDIFTLTPYDESLDAFMKCIYETMGITPSETLKKAFLATLQQHHETGRQKNIDFLRNVLNRSIAIAQTEQCLVTEQMIIEQLAVG